MSPQEEPEKDPALQGQPDQVAGTGSKDGIFLYAWQRNRCLCRAGQERLFRVPD